MRKGEEGNSQQREQPLRREEARESKVRLQAWRSLVGN